MRKTITMLFDSILRTQSGKCIPYYDTVWTEDKDKIIFAFFSTSI